MRLSTGQRLVQHTCVTRFVHPMHLPCIIVPECRIASMSQRTNWEQACKAFPVSVPCLAPQSLGGKERPQLCRAECPPHYWKHCAIGSIRLLGSRHQVELWSSL